MAFVPKLTSSEKWVSNQKNDHRFVFFLFKVFNSRPFAQPVPPVYPRFSDPKEGITWKLKSQGTEESRKQYSRHYRTHLTDGPSKWRQGKTFDRHSWRSVLPGSMGTYSSWGFIFWDSIVSDLESESLHKDRYRSETNDTTFFKQDTSETTLDCSESLGPCLQY